MARAKSRQKPPSSRLYHLTTSRAAKSILSNGFRDGTGTYLTDREWKGVWLTNEPDLVEGAKGDRVLRVRLRISLKGLRKFEWPDPRGPYREWLVPALFLKQCLLSIDLEPESEDYLFYKSLVRKGELAAKRARSIGPETSTAARKAKRDRAPPSRRLRGQSRR